LGSYRRAGRLAEPPVAVRPPECPREDMDECSPKTARLIAMTLDKQYAAILPEALALLANTERRLPAFLLPELLDAGRRSRDIRSAIQKVAGRRGAWLAGQNPEWSYLASEDDNRTWTEGTAAARLSYYIQIRSTSAEQARTLLAETWTQEGAGDRAAFLTAWEDNLTAEDEPFLESALDDRSKEVRKTAVLLLIRLPSSNLVQRTISRAEPLLSIHKPLLGKARLEVAPPAGCDAAAERDGVEVKPPQGEGEKAFWLRQIVASAPLEFWTGKLGRSAPELVALARGSDWASPLLIGWRQAARRSRDKDWLVALIHDALENDPAAASTVPELASRLSAPDFEALLGPIIAGVPMSDKHPALALTPRHPSGWSLEFARSMAKAIVAGILQDQTGRMNWWSYTNLLSEMGRHAPPHFAGEFQALWPEEHPTRGQWGRYADETAQTLTFRNALHTAISEENTPL
ncbi:MAG: DUF5691 domain-containing protein, partial [Capsulimonas sp.]|uniref:DUF5691 domain-containing protein n=1 Tax=Capsulimonas sp. TaxID=2494211 RepID=UPI003264F9F7